MRPLLDVSEAEFASIDIHLISIGYGLYYE